jgi:hypothetical protein
MRSRRHRGLVSILIAGTTLAAGASCDRRTPDVNVRGVAPPPDVGAVAIEPGKADQAAADGQTIYVPAYSAIATADNSRLYQLAITLTVRNTDRTDPIVLSAARYYDRNGRLIRDFLEKPLRIAPLAATEFFIREGDTRGGTAACFLVDWVAERDVSDPVVEAVMVGTTGNQGISFTYPGRVVADRGRRVEPKPKSPLP